MAGGMLSVPANTVHAFAVVSETARVLNLDTPGGFTEQVSYLGAPASAFRLPRDGEQLPPSPDRQNAYLPVRRTQHTALAWPSRSRRPPGGPTRRTEGR